MIKGMVRGRADDAKINGALSNRAPIAAIAQRAVNRTVGNDAAVSTVHASRSGTATQNRICRTHQALLSTHEPSA